MVFGTRVLKWAVDGPFGFVVLLAVRSFQPGECSSRAIVQTETGSGGVDRGPGINVVSDQQHNKEAP